MAEPPRAYGPKTLEAMHHPKLGLVTDSQLSRETGISQPIIQRARKMMGKPAYHDVSTYRAINPTRKHFESPVLQAEHEQRVELMKKWGR